jgi:hypothetical protein
MSAPIGYVTPAVRGTVSGRCVLERRAVHVADLQAETEAYPEGSTIARELGLRTILAAGFDAHRFDPLSNLNLSEADFAWATQRIMKIADVLNEVCPGVRKAAYMAANLPEPGPFYDEGRDLTSEEFHQLTLRIINAATKGNVPVSDAISATAKAMGDIICILAELPGNSAESLVKWGQQAIAEFTQHAIAERAAQRSP